MVIVYKEEKYILRDIKMCGATVFNIPTKLIGGDVIIPDEAHGLFEFIENHNIESMDWQDWLDVLEIGDDYNMKKIGKLEE